MSTPILRLHLRPYGIRGIPTLILFNNGDKVGEGGRALNPSWLHLLTALYKLRLMIEVEAPAHAFTEFLGTTAAQSN